MKRGLLMVLVAGGIFLAAGTAMAQAVGPLSFYSISPCRILDTRGPNGPVGGPALNAGASRGFPVVGYCNIPSTARVVSLNVTFVQPTTDGYLTIWPYYTGFPGTSNINAAAWTPAIANAVITPLTLNPPDGSGNNIYIVFGTAAPGTAHVIVDINGYYQ